MIAVVMLTLLWHFALTEGTIHTSWVIFFTLTWIWMRTIKKEEK